METTNSSSNLLPGYFLGRIEDNGSIWMEKLEMYATINNLSEQQRIICFALLLKQDAAIWFQNLQASIKSDWLELRNFFLHRFMLQPLVHATALETIELEDFATVQDYISQILATSQLAGLGRNTDAVIQCLIRGLPAEMHHTIATQHPQSVAECI